MRSKKYLGVFFGPSAISVVETENQKPVKFAVSEYDLFQKQSALPESSIPDAITQTAILQKTIRDQKMSSGEVHLSVQSKDIIFRSFIIPWMSHTEIKAVIDFESRKYIPFKLNELSYTYHPVVVSEKDNKFIRILFAAIRTDLLENYCKILMDAGLRVRSVEPGPLGLIRVLFFKKLISKNQRVAIIQADNQEGKIIIVDQCVPQFIRDFQFQIDSSKTDASSDGDKELIGQKIFNEIKISLEYYTRQYSQEKVSGIIILSENAEDGNYAWGEKELGIPVSKVNTRDILDGGNNSLDLINAYGIGLKNSFALPLAFDLPQKSDARSRGTPIKSEQIAFNFDIDIKSVITTFAVCLAVIATIFFLTKLPIEDYRKKLSSFSIKEGRFRDLTEKSIEKESKELAQRLDKYKKIRIKSNVSFFLNTIPHLLPDGVWLNELNVEFKEILENEPSATDTLSPKTNVVDLNSLVSAKKTSEIKSPELIVKMKGYAYTENMNQQMRLVNNFVSNLKKDQKFMAIFSEIKFTTETLTLKDNTVTSFSIECN